MRGRSLQERRPISSTRSRSLADVEEPLPLVPLDLMIEVAVGVGAVEDAAGHVVDAHVEPGLGAAGTELVARAGERVLGHLPVDVEPLGIGHHGNDPILTVPQGMLARRASPRTAEIEPVGTIGRLVRRVSQGHQASRGLLDSFRKRALGEPLDSGESGAGAVEELTACAAAGLRGDRGGPTSSWTGR
jgi:hypothetical protein